MRATTAGTPTTSAPRSSSPPDPVCRPSGAPARSWSTWLRRCWNTSGCPYRPNWTDGRCWDDYAGALLSHPFSGMHSGGPIIERSQEGRRFGDPAVDQLDEKKGRLPIGARETVADGLRRAVGEKDATVIPEE